MSQPWCRPTIRQLVRLDTTNKVMCEHEFAQGDLTVEVLRNNDVCEEIQKVMRELDWITLDGYYSIRHFMILKVQ